MLVRFSRCIEMYFRWIGIFQTFQRLQNMAFEMFKNLGLFMIMRHIYSWQHQLLQEDDGHRRGSLQSLLAIWARNCSCLDCLTGHVGPTEKWLLNLSKDETVLWGSCFMKESTRHSAGHRRKWLTNCQYRLNCVWNFLFRGKVCWIL